MLRWLKGDPAKQDAERLYRAVVAAARAPALFSAFGAPDTVEGRFETLTLHMVLLQQRLLALGAPARPLAQALTDNFFADLDAAIREIGIGDISVPKKMKVYAEGYFGRAAAYVHALAEGDDALAEALARNVLGLGAEASRGRPLARYARALVALLDGLSLAQIAAIEPDRVSALLPAAAAEAVG